MKKKVLTTIFAAFFCLSIAACGILPEGSAEESEASSQSSSFEEENSSGQNSSDGGMSASTEDSVEESEGSLPVEEIVSGDMSVHFLYFDNAKSGDCTLIKVGDTEVLIDAGSTRGSRTTIIPYIRQYCTDGVLEYVVATHAHEDHIAGFAGEEEKKRTGAESDKGVFEVFTCETIIDYTYKNTTSMVAKDYEKYRDAEVAEGATHYTALECWKEENGAKRSYTLGEGITLNILYQQFYEQKSSTENNHSVCVLLSENDNHYLFTGDLESAGESSLVAKNDLPKCKLYKGGHHGSRTSSSMALLNAIQPEIVCVCSCCGDSNGFVHQEFIDNVAKFTDKVYVTTYRSTDEMGNAKGMALNGNIVVVSQDGVLTVECSNNNLLFKDTEWFKKNRTPPAEWR